MLFPCLLLFRGEKLKHLCLTGLPLLSPLVTKHGLFFKTFLSAPTHSSRFQTALEPETGYPGGKREATSEVHCWIVPQTLGSHCSPLLQPLSQSPLIVALYLLSRAVVVVNRSNRMKDGCSTLIKTRTPLSLFYMFPLFFEHILAF